MNKFEEFEREYGSICFLKTIGSAINRLLVNKGLVSEEELITMLDNEVSLYKEDHKQDKTSSQDITPGLYLMPDGTHCHAIGSCLNAGGLHDVIYYTEDDKLKSMPEADFVKTCKLKGVVKSHRITVRSLMGKNSEEL